MDDVIILDCSSLESIIIIAQNDGWFISWSHIRKLYENDMATGMGIRLVPKLKYEHISLNSFSKMRVDLAAQVNINFKYYTMSYT